MISIVIPAYNEEKVIYNTYKSIKDVLKNKNILYEILIASDGSKDNTNKIITNISNKDPRVISIINKRNNGMGFVLRQMFKKAKGTIIIQMDADLSVNPNVIFSLIKYIKLHDVVIASRYVGVKAKIPLHRLIASRIYNLINLLLFGINIKDTQSGFVAYKKKVLDSINLTSDRFDFHIELFTKLIQNKYQIKEIPVKYIHRQEGSKFNLLKDGTSTLINTFKLWFKLKWK